MIIIITIIIILIVVLTISIQIITTFLLNWVASKLPVITLVTPRKTTLLFLVPLLQLLRTKVWIPVYFLILCECYLFRTDRIYLSFGVDHKGYTVEPRYFDCLGVVWAGIPVQSRWSSSFVSVVVSSNAKDSAEHVRWWGRRTYEQSRARRVRGHTPTGKSWFHVFFLVSSSGMGTFVKKIKGMTRVAQKWGG